MEEYLAALSRLHRPPAAASPNPRPSPPAGGAGGGSSMSLWTTERIERIGSAVRSLASRGIAASSRVEAADLIYYEMNDPRISSAELLQFLNIFVTTRRCLDGSIYFAPKSASRKFRLLKSQQQGPPSCPRLSPYFVAGNRNIARPARFAWGLRLHRMFLDAVERLGGLGMAEPAAIYRLMKESEQEAGSGPEENNGGGGGQILNGLTVGEVGRHLVQFRYLIGLPGGGPVAPLSSQGGDSSMLDFFGDLKLS
ncbi:unnamed protein product [Linum trigynum]|uniref:Uncharacterized protein n=1 Tax=Linum trigynum TaxID=586398 RepID=A0AAV2DME2_9ROSI